jgi:serine/threonine protein kinase/tetratricopeptide (TPR) repeat protein
MGQVYLVSDALSEDRQLALKSLRMDARLGDSLDYFKHEFMMLAKLRHPNLAEVYDFGVDEETGECFFTSEYVEGEDLYRAAAHVSLGDLNELLVHICRGLEYIHSRGIIHYDIKPTNILIKKPRGRGKKGRHRASPDGYQVKLIDFGLAQDITLSPEEAIKGTVNYLAPELVRSGPIDKRADLYSLGVTLYHVATRELPFTGDSNIDIINRHLTEIPKDPRSIRPEIPESLARIVMKLMEKEPSARFSSANEVVRALNEWTGSSFAVETKETKESYIYSGKFVGRQTEFGLLRKLFREIFGVKRLQLEEVASRADSGPIKPINLVMVSGGSGIGKTRLLREFKNHIQLNRINFMEGNCYKEGGRAYQPFVEVIGRLLKVRGIGPGEGDEEGARPAGKPFESRAGESVGTAKEESPGARAARRDLLKKYGPELRRLGPELADRIPEPAKSRPLLNPAEEKLRLLDAVSQFILEIAAEWPMVIYLNDLHWADEETVDLLRYLSRNLHLQPYLAEVRIEAYRKGRAVVPGAVGMEMGRPLLMICGCYRDQEVAGGRLELALKSMREEGQLLEIFLKTLKREEVTELVGSMLGVQKKPEVLGSRIFESTRGNPFFIEELMKSLLEEGIIRVEKGNWRAALEDMAELEIPPRVKDVFSERVSRLGEEDVEILRVLSVFRRPATVRQFERAIGFKRSEIFSRFHELVRKQILTRMRIGSLYEYGFLHDIMRETLYETLEEKRKDELHGRIGEILEELALSHEIEENAGELSFHFEKAGNLEKALHYSIRAGDENRSIYANQKAIEFYEKALDLMPRVEVERRMETCEKLGDVRDLIGEYQQAIERFKGILSMSDFPAEGKQVARIHRRIGEIYEKIGEYDRALESYSVGMRTLGAEIRSYEGSKLLNVTASVYIKKGLYDMAINFCRSGLEMMAGLPESSEASSIYNTIGVALSCKGDYDEATENFEKSLVLRRKLGDLEGIAQSLNNLGTIFVEKAKIAEAIEFFEESLKIKERIGNTQGIAETSSNLGTAYHSLGHETKAIEYHRKSLKIKEKVGDTEGIVVSLNHLGSIYNNIGNYRAALENLNKALRVNEKLGETRELVISFNKLGRVFLNLGDLPKALEYVDEALRLASLHEIKREEAAAYLSLGIIERCQGKLEEAERYFNRALTIYTKMGQRYEMSRVMFEVIDLCLERGDEDLAGLIRDKVEAMVGEYRVDRLMAEYLLRKARLQKDDSVAARRSLSDAAVLSERIMHPELIWNVYQELGHLYERQENFEEAGRNYVKAMEIVKKIWARVPEAFKESYLGNPLQRTLREDFRRLKQKLL